MNSQEIWQERLQGDWAENLVTRAINENSKNFVAVKYGKSDDLEYKTINGESLLSTIESFQDLIQLDPAIVESPPVLQEADKLRIYALGGDEKYIFVTTNINDHAAIEKFINDNSIGNLKSLYGELRGELSVPVDEFIIASSQDPQVTLYGSSVVGGIEAITEFTSEALFPHLIQPLKTSRKGVPSNWRDTKYIQDNYSTLLARKVSTFLGERSLISYNYSPEELVNRYFDGSYDSLEPYIHTMVIKPAINEIRSKYAHLRGLTYDSGIQHNGDGVYPPYHNDGYLSTIANRSWGNIAKEYASMTQAFIDYYVINKD